MCGVKSEMSAGCACPTKLAAIKLLAKWIDLDLSLVSLQEERVKESELITSICGMGLQSIIDEGNIMSIAPVLYNIIDNVL